MDYKKTNAPLNTVTRDMIAMAEQTGNVYETVCIGKPRTDRDLQILRETPEADSHRHPGIYRAQVILCQPRKRERPSQRLILPTGTLRAPTFVLCRNHRIKPDFSGLFVNRKSIRLCHRPSTYTYSIRRPTTRSQPGITPTILLPG